MASPNKFQLYKQQGFILAAYPPYLISDEAQFYSNFSNQSLVDTECVLSSNRVFSKTIEKLANRYLPHFSIKLEVDQGAYQGWTYDLKVVLQRKYDDLNGYIKKTIQRHSVAALVHHILYAVKTNFS